MKEILIGYDAREVTYSFAESWEQDKRELFLIREDLVKPLSVDKAIWPSIFHLAQIQIPERTGYRGNLWADLEALKAFLENKLSPDFKAVEIAFTQFLSNEEIEESGLLVLPMNPSGISQDWIFLGYDIAEEVLLSGLLNMGYRPEEMPYAQEEFLSHLNQFHLFTDYDIARKFAVWNQTRDKGHGPFFVTGIYRINNENLASIFSEKSP